MSGQSAGRLIELAAFDNPRPGSFIPMLLSILRAAKAEGWSAEMVFDAPSGAPHAWYEEFERAGVPLRFAPSGNRRELGHWVADLLEESDAPTVLHTHFTTFDVPAVHAARRHPGAEVVWHQHMDLSTKPSIMLRNAIKFGGLGRLTDRILCPAPDTADAVRRVGAPRERVVFFPNAIDAERFPPPSGEDRARARSELEIAEEATVLLHFGWDWERKGGDIFLRALKALSPDVGEAVLGLTVTADPAAEALRDELGLGGGVRIEPLREDVQMFFAAADAFVAPSRAEGGTPFATLEALASGLPVIASDIPGHRFIHDTIPECKVVALDPEAVATAIGEVISAGAPLEAGAAERVRGQVATTFGLSTWALRLLDVYDSIVPSGPALR